MNEKADRLVTRLARHVRNHPYRLMLSLAVMVFASWIAAGASLYHSFSVGHDARVQNCRAIDELNRELRLAWTDVGQPAIAARFEDTRRCEVLP